ncbi:hypothetical protein GCM10010348_46940 [Streptomyces anthocyanicus]|uniref:Uncharacterized protein n=1 Tax=Streptomyces violaceolatus TaxID=67378 RepID=A0ABN3ST22_9ACTN|nr:hypothetical protein GCM10010348_46940 [Streptomyces anthocyanicus]
MPERPRRAFARRPCTAPCASPVHGLRPQALSAPRGVCEHEGKAEGQDTGPSRNESAVPPVGTVGKQSPYNPGEM